MIQVSDELDPGLNLFDTFLNARSLSWSKYLEKKKIPKMIYLSPRFIVIHSDNLQIILAIKQGEARRFVGVASGVFFSALTLLPVCQGHPKTSTGYPCARPTLAPGQRRSVSKSRYIHTKCSRYHLWSKSQ